MEPRPCPLGRAWHPGSVLERLLPPLSCSRARRPGLGRHSGQAHGDAPALPEPQFTAGNRKGEQQREVGKHKKAQSQQREEKLRETGQRSREGLLVMQAGKNKEEAIQELGSPGPDRWYYRAENSTGGHLSRSPQMGREVVLVLIKIHFSGCF